MRSGRFLGMVLVGSLVFGAGACGGDDDDSGDDAADETATDAGVSEDDLDELTGFLDDDCEFLRAGEFLNPGAALSPGANFDFDENAARFEALSAEAPDEIKDDLDVIADRMQRMDDALEGVDLSDPQAYGDPEVQAALGELEDIFDDEYTAATTSVSDYVSENCTAPG